MLRFLLLIAISAVSSDKVSHRVDLFFIRHVTSLYNSKEDTKVEDAGVSTKVDPAAKKTYDALQLEAPLSAMHRSKADNAVPPMSGTEQVWAVYNQLGGAALDSKPFKAALTAAKGVTFISSNLRRAQITLFAARKSLLEKFSANDLANEKKKLENADFVVTSVIQEHQGRLVGPGRVMADAQTLFKEAWKPDLKTQVDPWFKYMKEGMDKKGPPPQGPVFDRVMESQRAAMNDHARYIGLVRPLKKKNPNVVEVGGFKQLLVKLGASDKQMFVMGGHSHQFRDFVKKYKGKSTDAGVAKYAKDKVENGEMVHVVLNLLIDSETKEAVKGGIELVSITNVYTPEKETTNEMPVGAHQSISNLLLRESSILDEFYDEQEEEIQRLRERKRRERYSGARSGWRGYGWN